MNVAAEDQIRPAGDECAQHVIAVRDGPLARRTPRSTEQVVVQHDDPVRTGGPGVQALGGRVELRFSQRAALVPERAGGVEADDLQRRRREDRLGRLPLPIELRPRSREAGRKRVRQVVVSRNGEHGHAEGTEEPRRLLVLPAPPSVREVAGGDDHLRPHPAYERGQRLLDVRRLLCTRMEIGYMEEACRHDRMRL